MADLRGFNAANVEPTTDFDPLPPGKYLAVITEGEMKANKAGTGNYLNLTFEIIEGKYAKRRVWTRLNLENPNATAVKIARAELSAICRAVGVMAPNDTTELQNLPLIIHVKCRKRDDTGEIVNEVKGYSKRGGPGTPAANGSPTNPPSTNVPPNDATPPWRR